MPLKILSDVSGATVRGVPTSSGEAHSRLETPPEKRGSFRQGRLSDHLYRLKIEKETIVQTYVLAITYLQPFYLQEALCPIALINNVRDRQWEMRVRADLWEYRFVAGGAYAKCDID